MSVKATVSDALKSLRSGFNDVGINDGVYKFFEPETLPVDPSVIESFVGDCKKNKIDCIIPCLGGTMEVSRQSFVAIADFYGELLSIAQRRGIRVGLCIDSFIEDCFFFEGSPVPDSTKDMLSSKILNLREYYCLYGERVEMDFSGNTLMSVSLFNEEHTEHHEISEYLVGSRLEFTPTLAGNWIVNAFTCDSTNIVGECSRRTFNILDYNASYKFLSLVLDLLGEKVKSHLGNTLSLIYINDICFDMPNRRNWNESFNDKFREMFGFSPEAYYNCLFYNIGEKTPHLRSLFFSCRAKMLYDGLLTALADFSREHGLELVNSLCEPKLADCSWLAGDALANLSNSSCALLDKAYMYGINSLSLAASASQNFGTPDVFCELYGDYSNISPKIMLKDIMNAYSRGATRLIIHSPKSIVYGAKDKFNRKYLLSLSSRCRSMLSVGTQISDIAVLYPSSSMHSEICLYQCKTSGFEYPDILPFNDHMTVINMLTHYCGQDSMLLHPEVMSRSCVVSGNKIKMATESGSNSFGVLILPGISVISIENLRMIKEFYDNGGKIIATGRLPRFSAEYHPDHERPEDENDFMHLDAYATILDTEVRETVAHIFGSETRIHSQLREYYHNENKNGGEAYFLCASKTTSDGTLFCDENLLKRILYSFKLPLDVYMSNLPEQTGYDSLNDIYPNFSHFGYDTAFPGGGMVSHIHKRRDGADVFFFSNTMDKEYKGFVFLRGMLSPASHNPATGKKLSTSIKYVNFNGEVYTALRLSLEPSQCIFVTAAESSPRRVDSIPKIKSIEHNFLTE